MTTFLHTVSQHLPFLITRSKFGNLPVYVNYKKGRTRIITKIRNVRGDVEVILHNIICFIIVMFVVWC